MPTKHCCWRTCNSDSRYKHREHMNGVVFFRFPVQLKDPEKYSQWLQLCGRADLAEKLATNSQSSVARWPRWTCSKHFVGGKPTDVDPHPLQCPAPQHTVVRRDPKGKVRRWKWIYSVHQSVDFFFFFFGSSRHAEWFITATNKAACSLSLLLSGRTLCQCLYLAVSVASTDFSVRPRVFCEESKRRAILKTD